MGVGIYVQDTLRTFEVAATLGEEALGAYVISMATSPSDVLAVKLMQARNTLFKDLISTFIYKL